MSRSELLTPEELGYRPEQIRYAPLDYYHLPASDAPIFDSSDPRLAQIEPGHGLQVLIPEHSVNEGISYLSHAISDIAPEEKITLVPLMKGGLKLAQALSKFDSLNRQIEPILTQRTQGNELGKVTVDITDFNFQAVAGTKVILTDWLMDEGASLKATSEKLEQELRDRDIPAEVLGDILLVNKVGGSNNFINDRTLAIAYNIWHQNWAAGFGGDTENDAGRDFPFIGTKVELIKPFQKT